MNDADARMVNAIVLVIQGVLSGQIPDSNTAAALDQIVSHWYGEVEAYEWRLRCVEGRSALPSLHLPGVVLKSDIE